MRILHLIATNFFGGAEGQIVRHCQKARSLGYQCIVGTFVDGAQENELIHEASNRGIDVEPIHVRSAYDPMVFPKLRALFEKWAPSIMCTHGYRATILGLMTAKPRAIPLVAWSLGWTAENLKIRVFEALDRRLIRFADRIIAVSGEQKRRLMKLGIPQRKIQTIRNSLTSNEFREETGDTQVNIVREFAIPAGAKIIAMAGRLSPEKGHRYLIQAMALLLQKRDDVFLLILGEGVLRAKLEEMANRLGLNGHIAFAGFRKDIYEILTQIDGFVLPSLTEGLPCVILEAFAAGKPVVATAVGGSPELVRHMETGFLVPPQDAAEIADAIDYLLSNPDKARELARAGRELLDREFSLEKQTRDICDIYQQLGATQSR
jgi:glycosyltransferase involved in cell wall biosynthesis